jgi:hypothetical protein
MARSHSSEDVELNVTAMLDMAFQLAFEQVVIQASPNLDWGELMKVVEVCTKQQYSDGRKLSRLSLASLAMPPHAATRD